MRYVFLVSVLLLSGCTGTRAWLAGYDESASRTKCASDRTNQRVMGDYDLHAKKFVYTDYSEERIKQNVNHCVAQERALRASAGVPVVFTVPLLP